MKIALIFIFVRNTKSFLFLRTQVNTFNMSFNQPFSYDHTTGRWNLELHKANKDVFSQCGIKISVDPGIPTGDTAPFYQTKEPAGMIGASVEIRCFDNLAGWTSAAIFDLASLTEKLIEIMPKDKVKLDTFLLAERDLAYIENQKKKGEFKE